MVTQQPALTSGQLRRLIGQIRRRIRERTEEESVTAEDFSKFSSTETKDALLDLLDGLDQLESQKDKLEEADRLWRELIAHDPEESNVQRDYITKYGEYQSLFAAVDKKVKELKTLYQIGHRRLQALDKEQADHMPPTEEVSTTFKITIPSPKKPSIQGMPVNVEIDPPTAPSSNILYVGQPTEPTIPIAGQITTMSTGPQMPPGQPMSNQMLWNPIRFSAPQMKMPAFNGDIEKFHEFRDSFNSTMSYLQVDDLAKMVYLKNCLSGEAADLLRNLEVNNTNFSIAMAVLEEEYGGNLRIQNTLLHKLQNLPNLRNSENPAELRHLAIQASMIFDQLQNLGCNVDNIFTANTIEAKLPKRIISKLYSKGSEGYPTSAKRLIQKIKEIAKIENIVAEIHNKKNEDPRHATTMAAVHQHQQRRNGSNNKNGNQQSSNNEKVTSPCSFCVLPRMMHHSHLCRRYDSLETRKNRATEIQLCYRCLLPGHPARRCSVTCKNCNGNHHQALCPKLLNSSDQNGSQRNNFSNGNNNSNSMGFPSQRNNQQSGAPQQNQQTVNMVTRNPNGNQNGSSHGNFNGNPNGQGYQRRNQNRRFQNNPQQTHVATAVDDSTDTTEAVTHTVVSVVNNEEKQTSQTTMETIAEVDESKDNSPDHSTVIMMTADLPIMDKDGNEHIGTVFFDTGSNISYITKNFSDKLQLTPTGQKKLNVSTFASKESRSLLSNVFNVSIKNKKITTNVNLCEVPHIASNIITATVDKNILEQLLLDEPAEIHRQQKEVDILIGVESQLQILGQVSTIRLSNGLQLNLTDAGPILSGQESKIPPINNCTFTAINNQADEDQLCQQLNKFWSLETIGILDNNPTARADEEVNDFFRQTTTRDPGGRFIVRLPYKQKQKIPSNRTLALGQLQSTVRRLKQDSNLLKKYSDIFEEQLQLGFIERVPDESHTDGPIVYYLPHHPVIKESSKTTKVRIVLNGSSKASKKVPSLNDILQTGERLLPDTAGLVLRIRRKNIMTSADIQKAFLQLTLHVADRDATRFLWIDPDTFEVICYRYKSVPFGLKSSPFLLNKSVKTLLESSTNPMAKEMSTSFYVDNAFIGTNTVEEAKEFYHFSKQLFAEAQMNLCQWFSNSAELNNYIANIQQTPVEDRLQKLLGLPWDTETDELIFNLPKAKSELLTKRRMLQLIASCYDPIGILTPVSLIGKLFFQSIAKKEHAWDTSLNAEQHLEVKKILQNWSGEEWRIPRKLFSGNSLMESNQLELHVFTDSSKAAYGTVAYLRSVSGSHSEAQFLMSKSRVVPIKTNYSIPQLEALAILTGVRLANYCLKECHLKINKTYLWSDSMCSLDSLQKTSTSGSRFVRNRVKQIQEQGENFEFSHVPGKINPADLLTRGVSFEELKKSTLWIQGPDFLHSTSPLPLRSCSLESAIAPTTHLVIADQKPTLDVDYFSSFHRLLRMVMIMIQFITSGKSSTKQRIARSKTLIFRLAQRKNPPSDQTIASLQLQKDNNDDLWMFFGRAIQRPLIFLPHGHVTKLLILHQHEKNNHSSPMFTLSKLRESFWIPNGLSHVKRIIRQCKKCPRFKCRPYEHPPFAAFPDQRILPSKPFQHTGIDYAGPLRVLVNNVVQKVWFILFTCLYSRFVTTEIVMDMTTSNFLHALRRLSAQFGTPETIICDNAQQFHLLHDVIQVVKNQMTNSVTIDSITLPDFRFITPHSPWEGGIYERMIGLIKESLVRAGSTKRMFGLEELRTTLAECTNVVNCRPLTYISSDDDIFPLRPIDFIRPHHHSTGSLLAPTSNLDFSDQIPSRRNLIEEWEQLSTITEEFRRRWNREYIQVLQERKECQHKQVNPQKILPKIGDVVLIHQPTTTTATWPLGKIEAVKERSAIVKNGKTKRSVEYPWKLLFPLETSNLDTFEAKKDSSSAPSTTETAANDSTGQQNEPTRTLRRSARKITPTNFFTGLAILSLVAVTSAEEASTTIPSTTNSLTREEKESTWFYVPSWTMIFFVIFLFCGLQGFITATLCINCICTWILFIVSKLSQLFHQCFSCIWKICRRRTSESTILIVLFCLVQGITSCNEIASLQATDAVCAQSKEGQHCLINKVVTLNLRADAQMGCFNIKEANNKSEETIVKIKALSISSTCNERTHHFTREFTINHEYTHRCAGVGSCVGNTCENLNEQDSVPEISQMAMDGPGFSSCYGACGCITCDWCVSCSPSCIFSRLYAEPKTFAIYEVVQCPTWETSLEVEVQINGNTSTYKLQHGIPLDLQGNLSLTATGFSSSPSPIHGATFVKRMDTVVAVGYTLSSPAEVGSPVKGLIGELQCPSYGDAENFNCIFDKNICDCHTQGAALRCDCQYLDIEKVVDTNVFKNKDEDALLSFVNNTIRTSITSTGIINFELKLSNYSVTRIQVEDNCKLKSFSIKGCHSCSEGANFKLKCFSEFSNMRSTLKCPSFTFLVDCSPNGSESELKVHHNSEHLFEECTISCGKEVNQILLNFTLDSKALFSMENRHSSINHNNVMSENFLQSIAHYLESMWNGLLQMLPSLNYMVIAFLMMVFFICFCRFSRCRECRRRKYRRRRLYKIL